MAPVNESQEGAFLVLALCACIPTCVRPLLVESPHPWKTPTRLRELCLLTIRTMLLMPIWPHHWLWLEIFSSSPVAPWQSLFSLLPLLVLFSRRKKRETFFPFSSLFFHGWNSRNCVIRGLSHPRSMVTGVNTHVLFPQRTARVKTYQHIRLFYFGLYTVRLTIDFPNIDYWSEGNT